MRRLLGRQVYLDSNVLIYFLEEDRTYFPAVARLFTLASTGGFRTLTGDLSVTEVLVHPIASGDQTAVERIRAFLASGLVEIRPHTRWEFEQAAHIRASRRTSLPDALHLATAVATGCTVLVTNDLRMPSVPGLEVVRLKELDQLDG